MAIIMTIMVLEIPLPAVFELEQIIGLLKAILIFFVSFFIVGWFWNKHHHLIDYVEILTNKIIWRNLLFLFFVALIPKFTELIIDNSNNSVVVISYEIVFLLANICFFLLSNEVYKQMGAEKFKQSVDSAEKKTPVSHPHVRFALELVLLTGLIVVSLIKTQFSIVLYIGFPILIAVMNIFKDRTSRPS
jgi:uncharacterized membrane protein